VYQLLVVPELVVPCISTCNQVFLGVFAFHEATSCVASKPWRYFGEVHRPYS
jgi:hypothetical protein